MPDVDTSTEAVEARCQHLDHCATGGRSEDAALMRALAAERDRLIDMAAEQREAGRKEAFEKIESHFRSFENEALRELEEAEKQGLSGAVYSNRANKSRFAFVHVATLLEMQEGTPND